MIILKTVSLDELVPYWRNPKDNSDTAVAAVKESIERYDYQNPILVDESMTIIAGHTRYKALQQLGYDEVNVLVSDMPAKKAKEYRVMDNKTHEYSQWTNDLMLELKEFEDLDLVSRFFPNIQLDSNYDKIDLTPARQEAIERAGEKMESQFTEADHNRVSNKVNITCPNCHETFSMNRDDLANDRLWADN